VEGSSWSGVELWQSLLEVVLMGGRLGRVDVLVKMVVVEVVLVSTTGEVELVGRTVGRGESQVVRSWEDGQASLIRRTKKRYGWPPLSVDLTTNSQNRS
jgi:hypothetical protein